MAPWVALILGSSSLAVTPEWGKGLVGGDSPRDDVGRMGGGLCSSGSSEGAAVLQRWVMVGGCFSHDLQMEVAGGQSSWGFWGSEWLD